MRRKAVIWGLPAATVVVATLFLAWALQTPRLERVWRLQQALRLGDQQALSAAEFRMLQGALEDYAKLAADLTEEQHAGLISQHDAGRVRSQRAYLIRQHEAQTKLQISYAYPRESGRVQVMLRGADLTWEGSCEPGAPAVIDLGSAKVPALIEIKLFETSKKGKERTPSVRVDWVPEQP